MLHELGRMPRRGEAIQIGGLELKVTRADRRRIETLRVTTPRDLDLRTHGRRLAGCTLPARDAGRAATRALARAGVRRTACARVRAGRPCTCWPCCALPRCSCCGTGVSPREAAWRGFLFTGATFLAGTYWLYHSIHLVGQAPVWIALFLMLGLVAIMGAYTAAIGYVAARWMPAQRLAALARRAAAALGAHRMDPRLVPERLSLARARLQPARDAAARVCAGAGRVRRQPRGGVTAGALAALVLGRRSERILAAAVVLSVWSAGCAAGAHRMDAADRSAALGRARARRRAAIDEVGRQASASARCSSTVDLTLPHLGHRDHRVARVGDPGAGREHPPVPAAGGRRPSPRRARRW